MNKILICLLLFSIGCYRVPQKIEPQIQCKLEESYINSLKPAFASITPEERLHEWAKEYVIALHFAKEMDLYRAVSTFKRAQYLLEEDEKDQMLKIQYNILLCYYLGKRYQDVIDQFENSDLAHVDKSFPPFHDLLVILYASYMEAGFCDLANQAADLLKKNFPKTYDLLKTSEAFIQADTPQMKKMSKNQPYQKDTYALVYDYNLKKKSVSRAKTLNAIIPGTGYLYVGQKKAAVTSFFMNALFIGAAAHFFSKGQIAAGAITTSFELGWYFGGIHGAGLEAKYYNERLYECMATPIMNHYKLFPVFSLRYGF